MSLPNTTDELTVRDRQDLWLAKNRGALGEIAAQFSLSYTFVRKVFRGEMPSAEKRVEAELDRRGCPGFSNKK